MRPTVGIPRAFHYFDYFPLWLVFFSRLGAQVVTTPPTNSRILEAGVGACEDDACVPLKAYMGHAALLQEDVDYLFVPRIIKLGPRTYTCPKFLGLPEMVRHSLPGLPEILTIDVNLGLGRTEFYRAVLELGRRLSRSSFKILLAYASGVRVQRVYENLLEKGFSSREALRRCGVDEDKYMLRPAGARRPVAGTRRKRVAEDGPGSDDKLTIAVLGHPYLVFDEGLNLDLFARLEENGVRVITAEAVPPGAAAAALETLPKPVYWSSGRKTMGAALHLSREGGVDGIILLGAFGCGPDSLTGELIERWVRRDRRLPLLVLNLDEHAGEAGILTRLEAFIDMTRRARDIA